MYDRILVTLDTTPTDRAIIEHVKRLAKTLGSRVILLHVATGVPAQYQGANAGGQEVQEDSAYLDQIRQEFTDAGISAETELAFGDPVKEIVNWVRNKGCDLLAMSTHGHHLLGDIVHGTTASRVQHSISIPVLLLRARSDPHARSSTI
jgi:nucleotide-binding universal stress UspA family protein